MFVVSSRAPTRLVPQARLLTLSAVSHAESSSSSSSSSPSSASRPSSSTPRPGDSRGRGRSEGSVTFNRQIFNRRGEAGSALSRPEGRSAPQARRSSPRQFDDAPSDGQSFTPRQDLVRRDRNAFDVAFRTSPGRGAYRGRGGENKPFMVRPVNLRHAAPGSTTGGGGGRYERDDGPSGRGGGFAGRGGRGGGRGGRGGGRGGSSAGRPRKPPAYASESFLATDRVSAPRLAPSTLPTNETLYTTDDHLLASSSDKPLAEGPAERFPQPAPFYAKLRDEVYAEAPTSGLRVLKHRTNAEHLLVPSLGPAALAAGQALVGELPMLLRRGAKREDQLLASQTVEEYDPESETWLDPGKVDYSAEIGRRFDPYRPGKPHPRRVFRLTTHSTLIPDEDAAADAADALAGKRSALATDVQADATKGDRWAARARTYRSRPGVQIVVLENPPAPAGSLDAPEHAELLARIDAERAAGNYSRWYDTAALEPVAARFAEAGGGEAFRNGRQAAVDLGQMGLAWAGNTISGRERALVQAVVEGLVKR